MTDWIPCTRREEIAFFLLLIFAGTMPGCVICAGYWAVRALL